MTQRCWVAIVALFLAVIGGGVLWRHRLHEVPTPANRSSVAQTGLTPNRSEGIHGEEVPFDPNTRHLNSHVLPALKAFLQKCQPYHIYDLPSSAALADIRNPRFEAAPSGVTTIFEFGKYRLRHTYSTNLVMRSELGREVRILACDRITQMMFPDMPSPGPMLSDRQLTSCLAELGVKPAQTSPSIITDLLGLFVQPDRHYRAPSIGFQPKDGYMFGNGYLKDADDPNVRLMNSILVQVEAASVIVPQPDGSTSTQPVVFWGSENYPTLPTQKKQSYSGQGAALRDYLQRKK